jgi:hypothetical protein
MCRWGKWELTVEFFETHINDFRIRSAKEDDAQVIYELIRELADYERLADQLKATPEILRESLFVRREAEVLL